MTTVLRTPKERFADLPGVCYRQNDIDAFEGFEGLRMPLVLDALSAFD